LHLFSRYDFSNETLKQRNQLVERAI